MDAPSTVPDTPIGLERDSFMRQLITSLGYLNESILGSDVAGGYIMNVGLSMGAAIEKMYKEYWGIDRPFTLDEYAHVIVDLKQKIKGNFSLVSKEPTRVVVRTTSCPFDELVQRSPSLCFMTSSVFGGIAARNFGYAKVVLHKRIALGDPGCYVSVFLEPTEEASKGIGKEYFPDSAEARPDIAGQLRLMDSVSRLRKQLGESSSRWEELVRGAAEAIAVLDNDQRVLFANARWRELLGVEGDEIVGSTLVQLAHEDQRSIIQEHLQSVRESTRFSGKTWQFRHRDGSYRDVLVSAGPLRDERGQVTGALIILHDVTEATTAQRLKDEFLATASHELRTPVTTIRAMTDLLLQTIERDGTIEPGKLAQRLQLIRRESDRLALLGVDLLDASRLQRGKLPMQLELHDLNEIVQVCIEQQNDRIEATRHLQIHYHSELSPALVYVERPRIEQVLTSLLENAVKYSPNDQDITVRVGGGKRGVWVSVLDQGIGIPLAELPRLFTPFYRASNATSKNFAGLGLGLYLSRGIVEAHEGIIEVQSEEGQGTTFTVILPRPESE